MKVDNAQELVDSIFRDYIYEGLETETAEEYDAYEELCEDYLRPALEEAVKKYNKDKD